MGDWSVDTSNSRTLTARREKPKLDWTKLEQHLQEIGTLHTSAYRMMRTLAPALVLVGYWFYKHPGLMFQGPAWWYVPRVSLLEVGMISAIVFISRMVSGNARGLRNYAIHSEMSASMLAAFLCAVVVYPCLLAKLDWDDAPSRRR